MPSKLNVYAEETVNGITIQVDDVYAEDIQRHNHPS
jgi:hypothetical protein